MKKSITKRVSVVLLVTVLALLMSMFVTMSIFAENNTSDAMIDIRNELSIYKVGDEVRFNDDGYIGIPVEMTVFYDYERFGVAKNGYYGTNVALYFVNTKTERVGTESDINIISDLIERGFAVVTVDYLNNPKAESPALDWSSQVVRNLVINGSCFTDKEVFPTGDYNDTYVLPAGYNVTEYANFWSIDEHGADGSFDRIVQVWNNDFRAAKADVVVEWVRETTGTDGKVFYQQKPTQNGFDGSKPQWYSDADGKNTVDASSTEAKYIKIKHTLAETITDCTAKDGSPLNLGIDMHIVYPVNPEKEVPVMMLSGSSEHLTTASTSSGIRPHHNGYLFSGYAGVIYEHLYVPMAKNVYYGYFDGSSSYSVTSDHMSYTIYNYNNKKVDTAAVRYVKYLSYTNHDVYKFDVDGIGVFGNSKGGLFMFLGAAELRDHTTPNESMTLSEAIDERINAYMPSRMFVGHHGESRYQNGITEDYTVDGYTIRGGKLQPWTTYVDSDGVEKEILSSAAFIYASNGGNVTDMYEDHAPIFNSLAISDPLGNAYASSNFMALATKTMNVPSMNFVVDIEHTFAYGNDIYHNVDTYDALFAFSNYYLKNEAVKVIYTEPADKTGRVSLSAPITIKFSGAVLKDELSKVVLRDSNGSIVNGTWSPSFGGTEWSFDHDELKGSETYTLVIPSGFAGDNGVSMVDSFEAKFITEDVSTLGVETVKTSSGIYVKLPFVDMSEASEAKIRFFVENDAANVAGIYLIPDFDEDNPDNSKIGDLIGKVNLCGSGYYEIAVSEIVGEMSQGDSSYILLTTEKEAGIKSVYEINYGNTLNYLGNGKYTTSELSYAPDGTPAAKICITENISSDSSAQHVNSVYYSSFTWLLNNSRVFGTDKLTKDDLGRRYTVSFRVYDTVSRAINIRLSTVTDEALKIIDFDSTYYTVFTKANEWCEFSLDYTVYDLIYGEVGNRVKKIIAALEADGDLESPIYVSGLSSVETVTDMSVKSVSLDLSNVDGVVYKKQHSSSAFSVNGKYYTTMQAALSSCKSGDTVVLNKNYTITGNDNFSDYATLESVVIDLNGYKLYSDSEKPILHAKASDKVSTPCSITVKNGSVFLGNSSLVGFDGSTQNGKGKKFEVKLENVSVVATGGISIASVLSENTIDSNSGVNVNFTLDNCNVRIDRNQLTKNEIVVFPSGNENVSLNYTLIGGKIQIDTFSYLTLWDSFKNVDILKCDYGYTVIEAPLSANVPSITAACSEFVGVYTYGSDKNYIATYVASATEFSTKYGIIPEEYVDVNDNPFVMFDENGDFIGAYAVLLGSNGTGGPIEAARKGMQKINAYDGEKYPETAKSYFIVMRRDYTLSSSETFNNLAQIQGEITIDLSGYTLSQGSCTQAIFNAETKGWSGAAGNKVFPTTIMVVDGTLLTKSYGVIRMKTWETIGNGAIAGKEFTFDFSNVKIGFADGATTSTLLATFENYNTASTPTLAAPFNVILNNCTLDYNTVTPTSNTTVFSTTTSGKFIDVDYEVYGGEILGGNLKNITIIDKQSDYTSSAVFGQNAEGEYIKVVVNSGTEVSNSDYKTIEGKSMVMAYSESDGNSDVYTLAANPLETKYGLISEEFADAEKYPFVLFDGNGNFLKAFENWLGSNAGPFNYIAYSHMNVNSYDSETGKFTYNGGVPQSAVVLMRRNYTMDENDVKSENLGHIPGEIIVDLGGYTISQGTSSAWIFDLQAKPKSNVVSGAKVYPTTINVINGKILPTTKPVMRLRSWDSLGDGSIASKAFTINFNDIVFALDTGATVSSYMFEYNKLASTGVAPFFVNYAGCTFDFATVTPMSEMVVFNNTSDKNYSKVEINVYGGTLKIASQDITISETNGAYGSYTMFHSDAGGDYCSLSIQNSTVTSDTFITPDGEMKFVKVSDGNYILASVKNQYGEDIPQEYGCAENYPFVVFDENGKFLMAYSKMYGANSDNSAVFHKIIYSHLYKNGWDEENQSWTGSINQVIVLMRRDYTLGSDEYFDNWSQIQGSVTFDLNGFTLRQNTTKSVPMFRLQSKGWSSANGAKIFPTSVTVKNGSIYMYDNSVIALQSFDSFTDGSIAKKVFSWTFENVTFGLQENAKVTDMLITVQSALKNTGVATIDLEYIDCIFDVATNYEGQSITLFNNATAQNKYLKCAITISGCEIFATDMSKVKVSVLDTSRGSSNTFVSSNSGYIKLTVYGNKSAPTDEFDIYSGKAVFVKVSESADEVIYRLRPVGVAGINYAPKMSITLDSQIVVNVYIPVESTVKFTFNDGNYENLGTKTIDGKEYYAVSVSLPSASAAKDIKLVATVSVGDITAKATFTFSIPKYASKVLNNANASGVEKTLVKDVIAYVQSAYNYFAEFNTAEEIARVNALANEILLVGGDYSGDLESFGNTRHNTVLISAVALNLDEKPTIRFYVKKNGVKFYANGVKLNTVTGEDNLGAYVELDVYAYALNETITYTLGEESGEYHITNYLEKTLDDESLWENENYENLLNLIACFIKYTESAANYRNAVIGN